MTMLVADPRIEARLRAEREASGADRWDEMWDGTYFMPPPPNDEHQQLVMRLSAILQDVIGWPGLGEVRAGVNVSDREVDWTHNYRIPDVAVFLQGTQARNCGAHWCGGPDFAVEIVSPDDQSRDKLPFYSRVGVRELLLIDRDPWRLEWYQLQEGELRLVALANLALPSVLTSAVLPLTFGLVQGNARPLVEVTHPEKGERWLA